MKFDTFLLTSQSELRKKMGKIGARMPVPSPLAKDRA